MCRAGQRVSLIITGPGLSFSKYYYSFSLPLRSFILSGPSFILSPPPFILSISSFILSLHFTYSLALAHSFSRSFIHYPSIICLFALAYSPSSCCSFFLTLIHSLPSPHLHCLSSLIYSPFTYLLSGLSPLTYCS